MLQQLFPVQVQGVGVLYQVEVHPVLLSLGMRKWFKIMRLGFEYLNPARTFHSLRLMADVDGTLDHRAELMRAWSTNKALMAQAGLLQAGDLLSNMHLGPPNRPKEHAEKLSDGHTVKGGIKKKTHKAGKAKKINLDLTMQQAKNIIVQQATAAVHTPTEKNKKRKRKSKQNPYTADASMTAFDIDPKVTSKLDEYDTLLQPSTTTILEFMTIIPESYKNFKT